MILNEMSDEDLIAEARNVAGYQGYADVTEELASRLEAALGRERLDVEAMTNADEDFSRAGNLAAAGSFESAQDYRMAAKHTIQERLAARETKG